MARKKGKATSFDAMVKFFMQNYEVPTKRDVDKILARIDRLETLIRSAPGSGRKRKVSGKNGPIQKKFPLNATDKVLRVVKQNRNGASFAAIQSKTGFEEKKLRNIIFRLDKLGKIKRKSRGVYEIAA